jgi:hypothetical protein
MTRGSRICLLVAFAVPLVFAACNGKSNTAGASSEPADSAPQPQQTAPAPDQTGGFDGQRAFQHVANLVAIGPRTAGTDGNHRAQDYIISQLKSFGCTVDPESFHTPTPVGDMDMRNIVAKIPGASPDIVLFLTHYDTKRLPNFVGADDGGSSTGLLLEMARLLCSRKNALTTWIAFLDGEEAFNFQWQDPDNTYGSRELAAKMALSGDLAHTTAVILADMIGSKDLRIKRDANSTSWLTDLVWSTASRLGYGNIFVSSETSVEDDHVPFLRRSVPAVDIIDLEIPYWHTSQDTLDKLNARSLAIVGHVLIAVLPQLEQKFARSSAASHP